MNYFTQILLIVLFPLQLLGQMFPLSDHYGNNALVINPAFAGCHDALSITLSYRNQWVGFKDAPKSQILSIHTPIDNDRIGLGLLVARNSVGIYKETSLIGNYAYRMELHDGKLALGLGVGVTVLNVAWNELNIMDAYDTQLMNNPTRVVLPAFSFGTYYYTKKYFIGISMPLFSSHVWDPSVGNYNDKNNFTPYNYFFTGGYEVGISPLVKLLPSMLIKYHPNNVVQIDYNIQVRFKDRFGIGVGYRSKNILMGMLQCQLNYQIRLAYSYDFYMGSIGRYAGGSNEIVLNYVFRYARNVSSPRQF